MPKHKKVSSERSNPTSKKAKRTGDSSAKEAIRTEANDQYDGTTIVKLPRNEKDSWTPSSDDTSHFITCLIESNMNSILAVARKKDFKEIYEKFSTLKSRLTSELKDLKVPKDSSDYAHLQKENLNIAQVVQEAVDDEEMVQEEIDRLTQAIDVNKCELLQLQQKVTVLRNKLRANQNEDVENENDT